MLLILDSYLLQQQNIIKFNIAKGYDEEWSRRKAAQRADEAVAQAQMAMGKAEEATKAAEKAIEEADSIYIEALLKK